MRNIRSYFKFSKNLKLDNIKCIAKARDTLGDDSFKNSLNLILSTNISVYSYSCFSGVLKCLCNIPEYCHLPEDDVSITSLIYDDITDSLIVCLRNGNILSLQFDQNEISQYSTLTSVPCGIECVDWSPDREHVIVSDSKSVFLLSATYFEILADIDLCSVTVGQNALVNVGWGKKETQFHGSEGKAAAKKTKVTFDHSLINDDHITHMSWRGDSQIFSVSYWDHSSDRRLIKIFDKSASLLAVNEEIPGLTGPISWRPYGDMLAFSQCSSDHYVIGFLEKNGLKHGDFNIPSELKVKKVLWNSDSTILGLICFNETSNSECLLLWTTCNYHWYLKQKIVLTSPLMSLLWDDSRGNRLYGACKDGMVFVVEWINTVDSNKEWGPSGDSGYVSVIDNNEILLTSFKETIIPPPMSRWSLKCPEAINRLLFPSWSNGKFQNEGDHYLLCAILHNNQVVFWKKDGPSIIKTLLLPSLASSDINLQNSMNHWLWIEPDYFITCCVTDGSKSVLRIIKIHDDCFTEEYFTDIPFCAISLNYYDNKVLVQSTKGVLHKFDVENRELNEFMTLSEPCFKIEFNESGVHSLSEKNRLYKDGQQIGSQVTSFLLHDSFLLATTTLHTLIIFKNTTDKCQEISSRKLENGSKLVVATDTTVVLQLPRGNLEAIQPRALTIEMTGRLLDSKQFKQAVSLLLKQRIDLNLAVDHNPQHFLDSVDEFVHQVDPKCLTLLITELKPQSVTSGLYSEFYEKEHPHLPPGTKVEQICRALHSVMVKNQDDYILPILGTLVKMGSMSDALILANSEHSLQHLLFLVDVDKLYNEALLAYNLEAALKIAAKSQKDPKEYLPYLNSLRSMEANYMRYSIDKSLNRVESALKHISKCEGDDKFIECIHLVKENTLYSSALRLFHHDVKKYKVIAELYGDYLNSLKRFAEAGLMYKRSGTPKKAVDPYLKIGDWRECISLSNQCGYSDKEKEVLIQTVKGVLKGTQKYTDAAILCLEVLNNAQMCIEMLVLGKQWKEAVYTAKSRGHNALIESVIKKALLEHSETLNEEIKTNSENFTKHCSRLQTVRDGKHKIEVASVAEPWETQSDTSSVSSLRTSSSHSSISRSSKNTRKASRKMWSLKEGNPREEQALVSTLSTSLESIEKLSSEVQVTCIALLDLNCDDSAFNLQDKFKKLMDHTVKSKLTIWPRDPDADEISLMDERLKIPPQSCVHPDWELHILK